MSITALEIKTMSTASLLELFNTLEAPTIAEMQGEYTATLLRQTTAITSFLGRSFVKIPIGIGVWKCKAFRQINEEEGQGYNGFESLGKFVQRFPTRTTIAISRYDQRPVFQLDYRVFKSLLGSMNMVDEVRKVYDGLYLGIGTFGFSENQRMTPYPFMLEGPVHEYRGDIGNLRG
jgi:hypothetical protein